MRCSKLSVWIFGLASLFVVVGSVQAQSTHACVRPLTDREASAPICAGNAEYCEQFAYNCQRAGGQVLNLSRPYQCNSACFVCQGSTDRSIDLFAGNLAGTWLTCHDDDNNVIAEGDDQDPPSEPTDEEEEGDFQEADETR